MRKIIAVTILCFFYLLFKNEKAVCKSLCQSSCKTAKQPSYNSSVYMSDDNNETKQFDGFFFKI